MAYALLYYNIILLTKLDMDGVYCKMNMVYTCKYSCIICVLAKTHVVPEIEQENDEARARTREKEREREREPR